MNEDNPSRKKRFRWIQRVLKRSHSDHCLTAEGSRTVTSDKASPHVPLQTSSGEGRQIHPTPSSGQCPDTAPPPSVPSTACNSPSKQKHSSHPNQVPGAGISQCTSLGNAKVYDQAELPDPIERIEDAEKALGKMENIAGTNVIQNIPFATGNLQSDLDTASSIITLLNTFNSIANRVAEIHPFAGAALNIFTCASNLILNPNDRDNAIRDLLEKLCEVYILISDDKRIHELEEELACVRRDLDRERRRQDEEKPDVQAVLNQLNRQNVKMQEALEILSESWQNEGERRHQEVLEAVRATAQEQVPFNIQMYLDEFSKALATETRMLLGEVGKLHEDRRNIQHEIGYLLMMKSKYGPGGEFDAEWKPLMPGPSDVLPRPDQPPPAEPLPHEASRPMHSWTTWQPNPALASTPPSVEATPLIPAGSPGLFGPL